MLMKSLKSWKMVPTSISGESVLCVFLSFCTFCPCLTFFCLELFSGLKGMMPGIQDMLKGVAEKKGLDYDEWLKGLKGKKQWHVEVY